MTSGGYGVKVEQVNASGNSMNLGVTSSLGNYLEDSVGNVRAGDTQASSGTLNWPIHAQEDGTIYLKYSFMKRNLNFTTKPLEAFATVFVKVTGIGGKYKVIYDGNGGTLNAVANAANNSTIDDGASYTIPAEAAAEKEGYTFVGWHGGNPAEYVDWNPGQTIPVVSWDVHLTARFEENFKITFDPGYFDAKGIPTSAMSTGKTFDASAITPTLDGYTFTGWEVTKTGGTLTATVTKGADGKWVVNGIDSDITLRALWTKDGTTPATTHSVKFVRNNATDGSATNWPNDLTGAKDSTVTIPWLIPQAEGYTFLGWSTDPNATTAKANYAYGKKVVIGDTDTSLYAVWKADTVTIHYPTNNRPWDESHSPDGTDKHDGVWISETGTKTNVTRGSKQTFTVRLDDGYDPQYLLVIKNTKNTEDADADYVGRGLNYVGSYTPQH